MNKRDTEVIRRVIARLRCEPYESGQPSTSDEVREALTGPARLYLETWVIPALELIAGETTKRERDLAIRLVRP